MPVVRRFPWAGVFLLLLAAFLFLNVGWLHMHADEELSYESTPGDVIASIQYQIDLKDNQAPGWFVLFRLWRTAAGDSEFAGRVLGILTALLSLAIVFHIARSGFGRGPAAPLALLVLLGNGLFFNYALDIRPYPLVMLTTAFSMWMLQRWLARPSMRCALCYGLSIAAMLYVHYLLLFVVAAQVFFFVLAVRFRPRALSQLAAALALGLLLFLPWFPVMLAHIQHLRTIEAASGTARGVAGIGVSTNVTSPENILALMSAATNGLTAIYAVILLAGAFFLHRRRTYWLALLWALLVPALYLLVNLFAGVYAPRYVSHLTIGLALAVGAVLALLPRWKRLPLPWLAAGALAAANLALFPGQIQPRIPYRDLFGALSAAAQPDDLIFFSRTDPNENLLRWQRGLYLPPGLSVVDSPPGEWPRRVWFVTGNLLDERVQADFHALEASHPAQQSYGECSLRWCFIVQLMEAPPLDEPLPFTGADGALPFRGLTVDAVSADAFEARLWWQVPAGSTSPPLDYSIGFQLLDSAGQLIAQSDGPINHYGATIVQTSQMEPGRIYMDERTLPLPAGLPPGDYQLAVVVYQPWDGARLLLPDGRDAWTQPVTAR
ncbi:MAG: glycosyltransferase family 39 protein [Anaerolineae bacterium]|nr:glycosyltransferase family 39 protein [Anaerolineae bacterium]